jgi:hypothetical protein
MPDSDKPRLLNTKEAKAARKRAAQLTNEPVGQTPKKRIRRAKSKKPRLAVQASKIGPLQHREGIPLRHLADAPKANPPWRPGMPPASRPPGRPKERTFEEDARDVLNHGVPTKLRALVALRTGLPFDIAAVMSLRQAVILLMVHDAIEKGQLEKLDRILDRTDPKSRRVEHRGSVGHLHALAGKVLGMTEQDASEVYRQMSQGSQGGLTIEAEIVE